MHTMRQNRLQALFVASSRAEPTPRRPALPVRSLSSVACYDAALALRLGLNATPLDNFDRETGLVIREDPTGLEIAWGKSSLVRERPFRIEFGSAASTRRRLHAREELVVRACGTADRVLDLTAGLGRDALMIATAGRAGACCLCLHKYGRDHGRYQVR